MSGSISHLQGCNADGMRSLITSENGKMDARLGKKEEEKQPHLIARTTRTEHACFHKVSEQGLGEGVAVSLPINHQNGFCVCVQTEAATNVKTSAGKEMPLLRR